jgi:hypothetical protein
MKTNRQRISDPKYAAALAAGRSEPDVEIRARAVRYVPERDAIEIVMNHNAGFFNSATVDRCTAGRAHQGVEQARSVTGWIGN